MFAPIRAGRKAGVRPIVVLLVATVALTLKQSPAHAQTSIVGYKFESTTAPFAASTTSGVTATNFTATVGTLSQVSVGGNGIADIADSGGSVSTQFTITATQTITLDRINLAASKTATGQPADLTIQLSGVSSQTTTLNNAAPHQNDPTVNPPLTFDFANFTMTSGQSETFAISSNDVGSPSSLRLDNIDVVTPVPEPSGLGLSGALAALAAGALAWRRLGGCRAAPA